MLGQVAKPSDARRKFEAGFEADRTSSSTEQRMLFNSRADHAAAELGSRLSPAPVLASERAAGVSWLTLLLSLRRIGLTRLCLGDRRCRGTASGVAPPASTLAACASRLRPRRLGLRTWPELPDRPHRLRRELQIRTHRTGHAAGLPVDCSRADSLRHKLG